MGKAHIRKNGGGGGGGGGTLDIDLPPPMMRGSPGRPERHQMGSPGKAERPMGSPGKAERPMGSPGKPAAANRKPAKPAWAMAPEAAKRWEAGPQKHPIPCQRMESFHPSNCQYGAIPPKYSENGSRSDLILGRMVCGCAAGV